MRKIIYGAIMTALVCGLIVPPNQASAAVEEVITGLVEPIRLVAPAGDSRLFIPQRNGLILLFDQQGTSLGTFLDISVLTIASGEGGLLGLAFPPNYAVTGHFYIGYTNLQGDSRIARYSVSAGNPDVANPNSGEILLSVVQPASNHNNGQLEFGPDGMLYIGFGDGGTRDSAQDDQQLLGKILRIDVSSPIGYSIPPDNPFVDTPARQEIWAKGLRNPWCFSFDRLTGDLYIADVGQYSWEEIDAQVAGSPGGLNYGWPLMEGDSCHIPSTNCNDGSLTLPIFAYARGGDPFRCSITGGYVYRGSAAPSLAGRYFFSDFCSTQIWSLTWSEAAGASVVTDHTAEMTPPGGFDSIAAFGQDGLGELYVLDLGAGRVFRVVGPGSDVPSTQGAPYLAQNTPNPFNPSTSISFAVEADGSRVTLSVFDASGRLINTLLDESLPAGERTVKWRGLDASGRRVGSGVYLYRLEIDGVASSRKMVLLE
jgi:glucose/arabinose dehydrogenase